MAIIRGVVRHVGYWRGAIHRWSTVYHFQGNAGHVWTSSDCNSLRTLDDRMCWGKQTTDGGTYECAIYEQASGGVPVAIDTTFVYSTPAAWPGFSGLAWDTTATPSLVVREVALAVTWAAGLSSSGKPVKLRKWYHAVQDVGNIAGTPAINAAHVTSLTAGATALSNTFGALGYVLSSGTGRLAGTPTIDTFYVNHQMPRGRRRPALVSADGVARFPAGLLTVPGSDGSLTS